MSQRHPSVLEPKPVFFPDLPKGLKAPSQSWPQHEICGVPPWLDTAKISQVSTALLHILGDAIPKTRRRMIVVLLSGVRIQVEQVRVLLQECCSVVAGPEAWPWRWAPALLCDTTWTGHSLSHHQVTDLRPCVFSRILPYMHSKIRHIWKSVSCHRKGKQVLEEPPKMDCLWKPLS